MLALSIILPTYNERLNIEVLVPLLDEMFRDIRHEVIVVDDSSTDGTGDAVLGMRARYPQLRLLTRPVKDGIGSALRAGYARAEGRVIASCDADLSWAPRDLRRLFEAVEAGADLAVGCRHDPSVQYETPGLKVWCKYIASRCGNGLLRRLFALPIRDFTGNCRALRRECWLSLGVRDRSNFFLVETVLLAHRKGFRVREIPVSFADRRHGESKIDHWTEIPKAGFKLLWWRLRLGAAPKIV
ncbi:MAG: glycosyltransferase [Elusimicrobiota bacterium]